jgi:WD40 repeat protein
MQALSRSLAAAILLPWLVADASADDHKAGPTHPRLTVRAEHTAGVQAIAFSPDGKLLLSVGRDGTACLFEVEIGAQIHRLDAGVHTSISEVAFAPGARKALMVTESGKLATWNLETGRPDRTINWVDSRKVAMVRGSR